MKIFKNLNKKGVDRVGWQTSALYILMAAGILIIIYIVLRVIAKRILNIYL